MTVRGNVITLKSRDLVMGKAGGQELGGSSGRIGEAKLQHFAAMCGGNVATAVTGHDLGVIVTGC